MIIKSLNNQELAILLQGAKTRINNTNAKLGGRNIGEQWWTQDETVEVVGNVRLTGDREVKEIWMNEENAPVLHLGGKTLTIGEGGINAYYNEHRPYITSGELTSSTSNLTIRAETFGSSQVDSRGEQVIQRLALYSVIRDHKDHQVGLVITGSHTQGGSGQVSLVGNAANTFTGNVIVEGFRNTLHLHKADGVIAIRSNVYVRNQASLNIVGSDQIADSSTVTLSDRSTLSLSSVVKEIREKIHTLAVTGKGTSRLAFLHPHDIEDSSKKMLFLDELIIDSGAALRISGWQAERDFLLVRKDSKHLKNALNKITIDGWAKNQIYLKDYNDEYYSIEAAPEPATYGAILGAVGIALFWWRHRKGNRFNNSASTS